MQRIGILIPFVVVLALAAPGIPARAQDEAPQTYTLSGTVRDKATGDPIPGAEITLLRASRRQRFEEMQSVTTGPDGAFRFDGLEAGQYGVRAIAPGRAIAAIGASVGEGSEPITLELDREVRVRGRVVDSRNGRPVEGADVSAGFFSTATTDAEGRFEVGGISRDQETFSISVRSGDYLPSAEEVENTGADLLDVGEIRLTPGGRIEFEVRDARGGAVANPQLLLYRIDLRRFPLRGGDNANGTGGEDGRGVLRGVVPGAPFVIQFTAEGFPPHVVGPLAVPQDTGVLSLSVPLSRGNVLLGRVTTSSDEPLAGARIHLAPVVNPPAHFTWSRPEQDQGWNAASDAKGSFSLEPVAFGIFLLEVSRPGFRTHREVVRVGEGKIPALFEIALEPRVEPAREWVPWLPSLGAALDAAHERNVPAFVFMTMDGEVANEYMAANTYRQPMIIELASRTAPVITSVFRHTPETYVNEICPKYGSVTCEDHIAAEPAAAERFLRPGATQVPQHVFLRPSGDTIEQRMYYLGYEALRNMIVRALRTVNPEEAMRATEALYFDLVEPLRVGTPAERAAALRDLLDLTDLADELARTGLAFAALASLSPEEEHEILRRWLPGAAPDREWFVRRLLEQGSATLRAEGVELLREEGTPEAFATLVRALRETSDPTLARLVEAAVGVQRSREGLRVAQADESRRARVIAALARRGDLLALPLLFEAIRGATDPEVRIDLALELHRYEAGRVLPFLAEEIAKGGESRAILARVVGDLGDPRGRPILEQALSDPSVVLQIQAARSLGRIGDSGANHPLIQLLRREDLDASVQVAAATALVELGYEDGVPALIRLADHPVYGNAAQAALRRLYRGDAPTMSKEWRQWWETKTEGK